MQQTRNQGTSGSEPPEGAPHLWDALIRGFGSLGLEAVVVETHDMGDMLGAFLRWADLRMMWRGALL